MASSIVDKSRRNDRLAAWLIKAGGLFVIVAVIGILMLIARVALPLFLCAFCRQAARGLCRTAGAACN